MTTDYDAMTDEQLAVLVAERVMGWRSILVTRTTYGGQVREKQWYPAGTPDLPPCGYWSVARTDLYPRPTASNEWSPAASWADAGRVLEKMRADGWEIVLNFGGMSKDPERQCFATFMRESDDGGPWHDHQGIGESLPRAICIAALRAVESRA